MKDELKAIETQYDGRKFRSRAEARWAVFFNALGLKYEYEREGYDLGGVWYLPDFFLPEFPMWIEVKGGEPTEQEMELAARLSHSSGQRVLIAIGAPKPVAQFVRFEGRVMSRDWSLLADRRNEGEYWLARNELAAPDYQLESIGPVDGPMHDRNPLVNKRMDAAYKAAMSARFEHGEKG
jgi:hypothetical protein